MEYQENGQACCIIFRVSVISTLCKIRIFISNNVASSQRSNFFEQYMLTQWSICKPPKLIRVTMFWSCWTTFSLWRWNWKKHPKRSGSNRSALIWNVSQYTCSAKCGEWQKKTHTHARLSREEKHPPYNLCSDDFFQNIILVWKTRNPG